MKKLKIYLAGAIERAPDLGKTWRINITPNLEELGLEVLDPCLLEKEKLKGKRLNQLPEGVEHWHDLKKVEGQLDRFRSYMIPIIKYDLDLVVNCDILLVKWDKYTSQGAGTHGEITVAHYTKNLPIYIVADIEVPAWIVGCSTQIFKTFDELKEYLRSKNDNSTTK